MGARLLNSSVAHQWVQYDEALDVIGSLRHLIRSSEFLSEDPLAWKWVSLAMHSALQGALVCHLVTSRSPIGVVTEKNAAEWLEYMERSRHDQHSKAPRTYLKPFNDLLKAARKPNSAGDCSNPDGIPISDAELQWLQRFNDDIRNQLVHYEPMGWTVEVSGIPKVGLLISRIISDILEAGYAFRHLEFDEREEMVSLLERVTKISWPTQTAS